MEKILINENSVEAGKKISKLQMLVDYSNKNIVPAYNEFIADKLSTVLLHQILNGNFQNINTLISAQAEKEFNFLKIASIKTKMLDVIEQEKFKFELKCKKIIDFDTQLLLNYIEVKDGVVCCVPDFEEKIREDSKYYITEPKEIEIYNELKCISEAYNRLLSKCNYETKHSFSVNGISEYLDIHAKTFESEPSMFINYGSMILL